MRFDSTDSTAGGNRAFYVPWVNVFDHSGTIMRRVTSFDTETLVATIGTDECPRVEVAAGFCFVAGDEEAYTSLCYYLPAGLLPFVVPVDFEYFDVQHKDETVVADSALKKFVQAATEEWIREYLQRLPKRPNTPTTLKGVED